LISKVPQKHTHCSIEEKQMKDFELHVTTQHETSDYSDEYLREK